MKSISVIVIALALVSVGSMPTLAASKCSGDKIKAAGKKAAGKLGCHAKAVTKGLMSADSACLAKTEVKFSSAFAKAEAKTYVDDGCLTTGDAGPAETNVDQFVDDLVAELTGVTTSTTTSPPTTSTTATMSTTTTTLRFVDNGDGTVTDNQTGLQWEKKTDDSSVHDKDNTYTWGGGGLDGTAFTSFLVQLNNSCTSNDGTTVGGGFAGHCDWRLPAIAELQTILVGPYPCNTPCIDPIFGPFGTSSSTTDFWSSTAAASSAGHAWYVSFLNGYVDFAPGGDSRAVRAVRGCP